MRVLALVSDLMFGSRITAEAKAAAVAVQIPIGQAGTFKGIIDLIRGVAIYFNLADDKDKGKTQIEKPVPPEEKERYENATGEL